MKVFLVIPSKIMAEGLVSVFNDSGEFHVEGCMSELSHPGELMFRNIGADVIIVDPILFGHPSRGDVRQYFSRFSHAAIVALPSYSLEEEAKEQYDAVISIYDSPAAIIKKLRKAVKSSSSSIQQDVKDLTSREKEILVCVAKGMLNKEIADKFCISIHTVITHRKNISAKTGIKSIAGLTVYALLNNLLDPESVE